MPGSHSLRKLLRLILLERESISHKAPWGWLALMTNRVSTRVTQNYLHMPLCLLGARSHLQDLHELVLVMHWTPVFQEVNYDFLDQLSKTVEPKQYEKGWPILWGCMGGGDTSGRIAIPTEY